MGLHCDREQVREPDGVDTVTTEGAIHSTGTDTHEEAIDTTTGIGTPDTAKESAVDATETFDGVLYAVVDDISDDSEAREGNDT